MTLQREYGPDGCYPATVRVHAQRLHRQRDVYAHRQLLRHRPRSIRRDHHRRTTSEAQQLVGSGVGAAVKPIVGDVLVNAGSFDDSGADIGVQASIGQRARQRAHLELRLTAATPAARYNDPTVVPTVPPAPPAIRCHRLHEPGDHRPTMAFPDPGAAWSPTLPGAAVVGAGRRPQRAPRPTTTPSCRRCRPTCDRACRRRPIGVVQRLLPGPLRDAAHAGRRRPLLPLGRLLLRRRVTLQPGARVVAGEGRWSRVHLRRRSGVRADRAELPRDHRQGRDVRARRRRPASSSNDASLRINRRVSDSTSRGTETVAIRSVNFSAAAPATPAPVEIPDDIVYLADVYDAANSACDASLSTTTCLAAGHRPHGAADRLGADREPTRPRR